MNSLALKAAFLVYFLYSMRTVIRTESSVLICLLFRTFFSMFQYKYDSPSSCGLLEGSVVSAVLSFRANTAYSVYL